MVSLGLGLLLRPSPSEPPAEGPDGQQSWLVAIAGAVGMVFTFGTPMSYGILRAPLSDAFGIPEIALSTTFSVMLFTFFVGSGIVGILSIHLPSRGVILLASLSAGLIAPSLYVVETQLALTVVFAVLGLALGTVFVMLASVVPRWFEERRGAATGLIFVGNGLGLFLLPPSWQLAIARFGVHQGFLVILLVTAVSFSFAGLLCRRPPWAATSTRTSPGMVRWLSQLVPTRTFQYLFVGIGLAFGWYQLLASFAVDLFVTRGMSQTGASAAFGLIGGVSIVSRIGGGYVADVIGSRRAFLASIGCVAPGVALFFSSRIPILIVGIFLIGIGLGASATIYIPLLMQTFGPTHNTAVVGVFNVSAGIGSLLMPPLGTATIAYTNSFDTAVVLTIAVIAASFSMIVVGTEG